MDPEDQISYLTGSASASGGGLLGSLLGLGGAANAQNQNQTQQNNSDSSSAGLTGTPLTGSASVGGITASMPNNGVTLGDQTSYVNQTAKATGGGGGLLGLGGGGGAANASNQNATQQNQQVSQSNPYYNNQVLDLGSTFQPVGFQPTDNSPDYGANPGMNMVGTPVDQFATIAINYSGGSRR